MQLFHQILLLPLPVPEGPPLSPSVAITSDPEMLVFTVQPPEQGLRNGEITSYSINCDPSDDYPSVFVVMGTLTSESGIVGGFTAAADYDFLHCLHKCRRRSTECAAKGYNM